MAQLPYVYKYNETGKIVVSMHEANVVKMIFERYLAGDGLNGISSMLSEKQIPTTSGKRTWSYSVLNRLLSNGAYVPYIISFELFTKVQFGKANRSNMDLFLEKFKPELVGFTGYLPHLNIIKRLAAEVKNFDKDIITVVGGVQAEVRPQDFDDKSIDYVTSGNEMEQLRATAGHKSLSEVQPISAGFDYPFPDREKTARYRKKYSYIFHERCATIKTSFGCPFNCKFCFCTRITGGHYFCRNLESVMKEMIQIKEENVFIVDDNFLFDRRRVEGFCHMLMERGIKKRFILFGRTDFIADNPDTMKLLKSAGLCAVFIGIESFKQGVKPQAK